MRQERELADREALARPGHDEWVALFASHTGVANLFCANERVKPWYQHLKERRRRSRNRLAESEGPYTVVWRSATLRRSTSTR